MTKDQLISGLQIEADNMAYMIINQRELFSIISIFQSHCDFNLAWLYQISPEVLLHKESIKFLCNNKDKFKRKINIDEMLSFDSIIEHNEITNFKDFINKIKGNSLRNK